MIQKPEVLLNSVTGKPISTNEQESDYTLQKFDISNNENEIKSNYLSHDEKSFSKFNYSKTKRKNIFQIKINLKKYFNSDI